MQRRRRRRRARGDVAPQECRSSPAVVCATRDYLFILLIDKNCENRFPAGVSRLRFSALVEHEFPENFHVRRSARQSLDGDRVEAAFYVVTKLTLSGVDVRS